MQVEQAELEGGNLNLEYYKNLDRTENHYVSIAVERFVPVMDPKSALSPYVKKWGSAPAT